MEDDDTTLDGQFVEFAKMYDPKHRDGTTITLYRSDYWFRQAKVLDDRRLTMTDTGVLWWRLAKSEINWDEWYTFLTDLCTEKQLDQEQIEFALTNCGIPGSNVVYVPRYRSFYDTYKPKEKGVF